MIPSYQEEIRIHKGKDRIFWLIVFVMTTFLYFFFQGYYPNYEGFLDRTDTSKQTFLKPFGIIDIQVFPSPDGIWVNNEYYSNNSKTIFDLGIYTVSIQKDGYLPITFAININKQNPFYINVVNLLALPVYSPLPLTFTNLSLYDDLYLLHIHETGSFIVTDKNFQALHGIRTNYTYIGGDYFSDGSSMYSYSLDTEKFTPVMDHTAKLPLQCKNISYYDEKLFCRDTMQFIGPNIGDIHEKILAINDHIILTPKYIYNGDSTNTSWKYFEYQTGTVTTPENVVHIGKLPYLLEKGKLTPINIVTLTSIPVTEPDWGMDTIFQGQEFNDETILLGEKGGKAVFRIINTEKQYSGTFDFEHTSDVKVYKLNGVYIFTTLKSAYVYYKGAQEIVKILNNVSGIAFIDGKIFFDKEGQNYVVDLLRKEVK